MTTITMTFELSAEDFRSIFRYVDISYWATRLENDDLVDVYAPDEAFEITRAKMEQAIGEMFAAGQPGNSLMFQGIDQFVRHGCPGSIDSDVANCILQWCCFGKIKYG
jgi:hypothetical protein